MWRFVVGDCVELMETVEEEFVDAVVTDPPYNLGFMGRAWDRGGVSFSKNTWAEVLRILKPGGYALAFGGARTYHRLVCAVEDAGFEIRDCLMWLYGSGFPKSLTLPGGWGTGLKPAYEPIVLARRPLSGTMNANLAEYGTGALNIDGCRIPTTAADSRDVGRRISRAMTCGLSGAPDTGPAVEVVKPAGRWPANLILDVEAAKALDAQIGPCGAAAPVSGAEPSSPTKNAYGVFRRVPGPFYGDSGGPSRFFYSPKARRGERDAGCEHLPLRPAGDAVARKEGSAGLANPRAGAGRTSGARNFHPTVKPIELMRWLVRLVTPPGGLVLDPFAGSGTTGCACMVEGFEFLGFEQDPSYAEIAEARLTFWEEKGRRGAAIAARRARRARRQLTLDFGGEEHAAV